MTRRVAVTRDHSVWWLWLYQNATLVQETDRTDYELTCKDNTLHIPYAHGMHLR